MEFKVGDKVILKKSPSYKGVIVAVDDWKWPIELRWTSENKYNIGVRWFTHELLLDKEAMRDSKLKTLGI